MSTQPSLFDRPKFDGATFEPKHDQKRLTGQQKRVMDLMADGRWRTLAEIREVCGGSEAGISARLRDCRKKPNGEHTVNSRRVAPGSGLYEYQLILREAK